MSEKDYEALEAEFPTLASQAFAAARRRVLESGQSVLQSEGGSLYRVFPDGRKEFVKDMEPPTILPPGTTLARR